MFIQEVKARLDKMTLLNVLITFMRMVCHFVVTSLRGLGQLVFLEGVFGAPPFLRILLRYRGNHEDYVFYFDREGCGDCSTKFEAPNKGAGLNWDIMLASLNA